MTAARRAASIENRNPTGIPASGLGGGGGGTGTAAGARGADRGSPGDGVAAAGADVFGAGWEADSMNTSET